MRACIAQELLLDSRGLGENTEVLELSSASPPGRANAAPAELGKPTRRTQFSHEG